MRYVFVCWEGDLEQVGSGVQPLSYGQDAGLNGRVTVASLFTWRAQHFTQPANALTRHRPTENTSTCQTQRLGAQRDVRTDAGAPAAATAGGSREGFKQTRAFPDYGCNQSARGLAFPASRWRRNELRIARPPLLKNLASLPLPSSPLAAVPPPAGNVSRDAEEKHGDLRSI